MIAAAMRFLRFVVLQLVAAGAAVAALVCISWGQWERAALFVGLALVAAWPDPPTTEDHHG